MNVQKVIFVLVLVALQQLAVGWQRTKCGPGDQVTEWGKKVNPSAVLQEYPRPQMSREKNTSSWMIINGLWQFEESSEAARTNPPYGKKLAGEILVPFPVESCLSGVGKTMKYLLYKKVIEFPAGQQFISETKTVLLHFGAVDWRCDIHFDGRKVATHEGGFDNFVVDITSFIDKSKTQHELIVWVYDPSDEGYQVNGKQRISAIVNPGGL